MSDTPRTDAAINEMSRDVTGFLEFVGFAHKLERENTAMRKALEDIEHAGSAEWARKRAVRGLEGRP